MRIVERKLICPKCGKKRISLFIGYMESNYTHCNDCLYTITEQEENDIAKKIPLSKLPLHIHDEWIFTSSKKIVDKRLKEA